jgi:hypothetical protein
LTPYQIPGSHDPYALQEKKLRGRLSITFGDWVVCCPRVSHVVVLQLLEPGGEIRSSEQYIACHHGIHHTALHVFFFRPL